MTGCFHTTVHIYMYTYIYTCIILYFLQPQFSLIVETANSKLTLIIYMHIHILRHLQNTYCMNALIVQNPRHKCDWETGMITDKKIIADCNLL